MPWIAIVILERPGAAIMMLDIVTGEVKNCYYDARYCYWRVHYQQTKSLRTALLSCINPMDPDTYLTGSLLNILSGQLAQPDVYVDRAFYIGTEQLMQLERLWPECFYNSQKASLTVGEHAIIDQEANYARVIGLGVSHRDLDFQQVATELNAYAFASSFRADDQMRVATGKCTEEDYSGRSNHMSNSFSDLCVSCHLDK